MGWSSGYFDRESLVRDICKEWIREDPNSEVLGGRTLKRSFRGNVLWSVREIVFKDGATKKFIGCDLLKRFGKDDWGYKDMDEGMHPYYYTCPLSYLTLVTEENSVPGCYNAEWRAMVLAKAAHARAVRARKRELS